MRSRFDYPAKIAAPRGRQRGATLAVCMVILLALTLTGVLAMRTINTERLLTNGFQHQAEAFAAAEAAAYFGQRDIEDNFDGSPDFNLDTDGDGYYSAGTVVIDDPDWSALPHELTDRADGRYIIEYIGPAPAGGGAIEAGTGGAAQNWYIYRIVGGGDSTLGASRMVEIVYASD